MSARTILKHVLRPADGVTEVNVPTGSGVRHVGYDPNNLLCLWIEQPVIGKGDVTKIEMQARRFAIVATGVDLPKVDHSADWHPIYCGTAAAPGQQYVWHVYEVA